MIRFASIRRCPFVPRWVGVLGCACALTGCGGAESKVDFDSIGELRDAEQLSEVSLGSYQVPIPSLVALEGNTEVRNLVRVDFKLCCVVAPEDEKELRAAIKRQRGAIHDRVITIFRQASLEDLAESDHSTIKTRLKDELQPMLGSAELRRLLLPEVRSDSL